MLFHCLIWFALLWTSGYCLQATTCNNNPSTVEVEALQVLYDTTYGEYWYWYPVSAGKGMIWDFTTPNPNPCDNWQGVSCTQLTTNDPCQITTLALDGYNLIGSLPNQLGNLTYLTKLQISTNPMLYGSIPQTIGNLKNMQDLELFSNVLSGAIPTTITQLNQLQTLVLYANYLGGTFPENIDLLSNLVVISCGVNQFIGSIPKSITRLKKLQVLYVNSNYLDGNIPDAIGNMTSLTQIGIFSNQLTGIIPTSITNLTSLQNMYLNNLYLHDSIPNNIGNLQNLINIYLFTNLLSGNIPPSLTTLVNLQSFAIYGNALVGTIPHTIGNMTSLSQLYLNQNKLSGTIPSSITNLPFLQILDLGDNPLLHGTIPEDIGKMSYLGTLNLYNISLTGTLPSSLTQLIYLQELSIGLSQIHGTIPNDIDKMVSLVRISLNDNQLTGTIPNTITNLPNLKNLYLYENQLNGTIPYMIGNLQNLVEMDLSTNALRGSIPPSLYSLQSLTLCYLIVNQLHGSISNHINNMTSIQNLIFSKNQLTGTLPTVITEMHTLQRIDLTDNLLNGTIPQLIGNLLQLRLIGLSNNQLTGIIPPSITKLQHLTYLYLYNNQLVGSIPEEIGNLTKLQNFEIYNNKLTGTLPNSIVQLPTLVDLVVHHNYLHGTIPEQLGNLNNSLGAIFLNNNDFTGTIPNSVFDLWLMVDLELAYNRFTGNFTGKFSQYYFLENLNIGYNFFTGTFEIPTSLVFCSVEGNYLHGAVDWMTSLVHAKSIVVSDNLFSGRLPQSSRLSVNLTYFQASQNQLSGSIVNLIDPTRQNQLLVLDLSSNKLTGSIPNALFQVPNLTYVILAENCFTGSIPSNICNPKHTLEVLVMDGLHGASECQQRLFPGIPSIHTLADIHSITGSIPQCLFGEMLVLETLHMSGNQLTGSLPDGYSMVDAKLKQLSLSHNALSGTVPVIFQSHGFLELDLSFNLLTGELKSGINVTGFVEMEMKVSQANGRFTTSGLQLNNNRLSGEVPSAILSLQYIDILAGNMFSCNTDDREGTLPQNDDEFETYMCGSDEANNGVTTFGTVFLAVVILFVIWRWKGVSYGSKTLFGQTMAKLWELVLTEDRTIQNKVICEFVEYLHALRKHIVVISLIATIVFMLVYGLLGIYFSTYTKKYLWSISIGFLSGVTPGACLMVLMISLLLLDTWLAHRFTPNKTNKSVIDGSTTTVVNDTEVSTKKVLSWTPFALVLVYVLINICVVLTVNGTYVSLIISGISPSEQTLLTIAMSLFKSVWSFIVMGSLRWKSVQELEAFWGTDSVTNWLLFVCLFNSIITPAITTAMLNNNCFYYSLVLSDEVAYSNAGEPITFCEAYFVLISSFDNTGIASDRCSTEGSITISTTYQPPFTYFYNCSSTLLSIFVPVWVYMFLIGGIVTPLLDMFSYIQNASQEDSADSISMEILSFYTWLQNWLMYFGGLKPAPKARIVAELDDREQVIVLCNNFAILFTFGILFPPLAVMGCIALVVQLSMWKVLVLDLQHTCEVWSTKHPPASNDEPVATVLENDVDSKEISKDEKTKFKKDPIQILKHTSEACKRFPTTYQHTMKSIVFYVSIIWGVFLWDIVGGDIGLIKSIWTFVIMVAVGLSIRYHQMIIEFSHRLMLSVRNDASAGADSSNENSSKNRESHLIGEEKFISGIEVENPIYNIEIDS